MEDPEITQQRVDATQAELERVHRHREHRRINACNKVAAHIGFMTWRSGDVDAQIKE